MPGLFMAYSQQRSYKQVTSSALKPGIQKRFSFYKVEGKNNVHKSHVQCKLCICFHLEKEENLLVGVEK